MQDKGVLGKASTTGALSYASTGGVVNLNDFFIATERKKRSADIALLEKQKNNYKDYVAVADKVKELIEGKSVKGKDVYTHESLQERGVSQMHN